MPSCTYVTYQNQIISYQLTAAFVSGDVSNDDNTVMVVALP